MRVTPRISDALMRQRKNHFIHHARSLHALVMGHAVDLGAPSLGS
jgi:hypothetical protein